MTAQTKAKRLFMDNVYGYDKVNNIKTLVNKAPIPSSNLMGGASTYSYDYDDLYRLTDAEGSFKGSNEEHTYTLSMDYNSVGGITHKTQVHKKGDQEQKKTTYDLAYAYGETQPHAPIHIGDQTYTYDANGNQTGWTSDVSGQRRVVLWDEENRIRSIYDNGSQHHYIYDAAGERVIKGKSTGQRIFVNGEWMAGSGQLGNYTVYVNPYLVLKSGGYTKHYYIEGQRIVSKLGGGWDSKSAAKAGGNKVDYVGKSQKVFDGIVKNLKFMGADGQVLTAGKSGKIPPGQVSGTGGNVAEAFRYFYHPDHLGSTSYVTDASGEVYQHLEYFAFGETFVEEHSNTDRTPYLFNGKELDEETGLYYYGARYYDPRSSVWQSVDPLAEKYPGWSPFMYAANNPVLFVDPDGKKVMFAPGVSKEFKRAFAQAIKHLNKHNASGIFAKLEKSKETYYIKEGKGTYNSKTRTIGWDPTMGAVTDEGAILSPTTVLNHEADHALQHDQNPDQYNKDSKTKDKDYDNKEEKRVITGSEQETAKKLVEIKEGEVTRKNHKGTPYETKGPTTTEGKYEIIVTPDPPKEKKID